MEILTPRNMKEIEIEGRVLQYKSFTHSDYDYKYSYTEFYEGYETIKFRKWWIIGPWIEKKVHKRIFTIYESLDSGEFSKEWWRKKIIFELKVRELKRRFNP
jgi:hypothetical protein